MRLKPRSALVMAGAALVALALVPGSLSSNDTSSGAGAATSSDGAALDVALAYVDANPAALGVTGVDVSDLFATSIVESRHSGVTHVNLGQRFQGLEVFGGHASVGVAADGRVVFAAGAFG